MWKKPLGWIIWVVDLFTHPVKKELTVWINVLPAENKQMMTLLVLFLDLKPMHFADVNSNHICLNLSVSLINVSKMCWPPQQSWQMQTWISIPVMPGHPPRTPCSAQPCAKTALWCWKDDLVRLLRCPPPRPGSTATPRSVNTEVLAHWS